jgi:peptidoglycan/xylan/chitin deacetylase (PgdA/CDA1 family)
MIHTSRWVWRLPPGQKRVALTFDDGPHPETTPLLLDALERLAIPATHFVIGCQCSANAALLRRAAAHGHIVGSHGFEHRSLLLRSTRYQRDSIDSTNRILHEILGEDCRLFRPPFGQFGPWTTSLLRDMNLIGVIWSVIVRDWVPREVNRLASRLDDRLHDGAIIVLHDGHPTTPAVIRLLPQLSEAVRRRGWSFVTLSPSTLSSALNPP